MATIGRSRAVAEIASVRFAGRPAWWVWLLVHIYYLVGFKNRLVVILQWIGAFVRFSRGARLIVGKDWRFYPAEGIEGSDQNTDDRAGEEGTVPPPGEKPNSNHTA